MIEVKYSVIPISDSEKRDPIARAKRALNRRRAELRFKEYPLALRKKLTELGMDPAHRFNSEYRLIEYR